MANVLFSYVKHGRQVSVVQVGDHVAEVIVEPHHDSSGAKQGYIYTVRSSDEIHDSSDLALAAGIDDVWKLLTTPTLPPIRQA